MVYVPHWKISMIGRIGGSNGPEMFSMSLALINRTNGSMEVPGVLDPSGDVWDDIADDCAAWFGRTTTRLHQDAVLKTVKIAPIGANGRYTGAPVERVREVTGGTDLGYRQANQTSYAVTLHTEGDLGRVKGRFYAPLPGLLFQQDGRIAVETADGMEASAKTFIQALNNQPGIDVLDLVVGVASQGRRNADGSLRVAPRNWPVTEVSVGRVPDVQRRRRNKLSEARTPQSV